MAGNGRSADGEVASVTSTADEPTDLERTEENAGIAREWAERPKKLGHQYCNASLRGERLAWFVDLVL